MAKQTKLSKTNGGFMIDEVGNIWINAEALEGWLKKKDKKIYESFKREHKGSKRYLERQVKNKRKEKVSKMEKELLKEEDTPLSIAGIVKEGGVIDEPKPFKEVGKVAQPNWNDPRLADALYKKLKKERKKFWQFWK